jgi:mono/diheme cytochrome c family protein
VRSFKLILLVIFAAACWAAWLPVSRAQKRAAHPTFAKTVQPFFAEHCNGCHNAEQKAGGLNLEVYQSAADVTKNREIWEEVMLRLQTGQMPPKGMPRPDKIAVETVTRWIEQQFALADRNVKPDPGRVTARRLNRAEYNNTVRDLLGVDIEPANDFPQDDSAHGFDNIADALSLSPTLMEKYLAAAEKIARLAVFGPELKPLTLRIEPVRPRRMEINPIKIEQPPFYTLHDYDVTGISHPGSYHLTHRFPATGEYLIRVRADGARPPGSEPQMLDLYLDGKVVKSFTVIRRLTATNETLPTFMEVRLKITAGQHQLIAAFPRLFEGLPPSFNGPNPSKLPQPPPPDPARFFPALPKDATPEQIKQRETAIERFRNRKPTFEGMAIAELEINGPFDYVKGPARESQQKLYTCGHLDGQHQPTCARKIIGDLAHRAFRRPVEPAEVAGLVGIVTQAQERGRSFEQALTLAVQTILVSPDFLFRIEKARDQLGAVASYQISPHELASRLSYFLWSSMPDEELLRSADQGTLRRPAVLAAQVRRMLQDPKARALTENFAGQWLEIRRLESVQPDRDRFPDFDELLRAAMLKETELFFQNIAQTDGSILDFIDGRYTFLNERLARHYGIKGVTGPEFRKVELTGTGRSGILTQASVLTVSSYGNRTSPVLRGKYILENVLNTPPPPPPANVPSLDEAVIGSKLSLRQQLEQHRVNPVCASCHARMDPLGFALEKYDAVGAWRTQDGKFPIDTSGTLPNGKAFDGAAELIGILKGERNLFTEALTEKLLTYALGRGVERHDRAALKKIAANVAAKQYRFSSLVLEIVMSLPFQRRTDEQRPAPQIAHALPAWHRTILKNQK